MKKEFTEKKKDCENCHAKNLKTYQDRFCCELCACEYQMTHPEEYVYEQQDVKDRNNETDSKMKGGNK